MSSSSSSSSNFSSGNNNDDNNNNNPLPRCLNSLYADINIVVVLCFFLFELGI
jgi:hypothetical protein